MRKIFFLLLITQALIISSNAQYWQQQVNYTIDVSLDDKNHTLDGFETIEYINNSPDTLHFIWFHLWPNAYKNDKTALSDQLTQNGETKFYFSNREDKGYINRLNFKVDNITAQIEDHPQHIDIIKVILPAPLAPGNKTIINTSFHLKFPALFSRLGHDGESYQATQWYPKPAVYDKDGWHPMPYLDQGEFYSEFGNYNVSITLPSNYVVAATGELEDPKEKEWLKTRADFKWEPVTTREKIKGGGTRTHVQAFPVSSTQKKTIQFLQSNVHDFAWFADKRFVVEYDTCQLSSGKTIDVYSYYIPADKKYWEKSTSYSKKAIHHFSSLVGEYPYNVVSVVEGPSTSGGMEYPTITVIQPTEDKRSLEATIVHEVGHNWFYGILGNNERKYAWMDEGINSYYDNKYWNKESSEDIFLETFTALKKDQPISTPAGNFHPVNYGLIAYVKAAKWIKLIEEKLGESTFNSAMQEYYRQWQFKHPQPADFRNALEKMSRINLEEEFALLDEKGPLPGIKREGIGLRTPFNATDNFPGKNSVITIIPGLGFNSYDKLMAGLHITNLKLPFNKFQFLLSPMYAFGTKKLVGLGYLNYSFLPDGIFRKIEVSLLGSGFTYNRFEPNDSVKLFMGFKKIVPGIKFLFKQKNPRDDMHTYIQFKTFLIEEEGLRSRRDSIITPIDTTIVNRYSIISENRVLNQLKFVVENNRVLYPYRGELKIEQGKYFLRAGFTGNYFFNYPKSGGLNLRLFAGKFIYTSSRTSSRENAVSRYNLNLLAPSGYEDYTYSDYFVGRSHFEGLASQQVMERDGAMKLRLEQFEGDPEFRQRILSDNWLLAMNLKTTIPPGVLPSFIPLKIFLDIGTSAGMWENNNTYGKFAFVTGLQLSFFNDILTIYAPLLYSREYKNLLQSDPLNNKFFKKISFSIDISNYSTRKLHRFLDF